MSLRFASLALTAALMGTAGTASANELEVPPAFASSAESPAASGGPDRPLASAAPGRSSVLFGQALPRGVLPGFDRGLTTASNATADTATTQLQSPPGSQRRLFNPQRPLTYMNNLLRLDY